MENISNNLYCTDFFYCIKKIVKNRQELLHYPNIHKKGILFHIILYYVQRTFVLGRSLSSAVFLPYIKTKIYCT